MRGRVVWSPLAIQRAAEAADFIAPHDPGAAQSRARGLFDRVRSLARLPRRGRMVPEVGRPEIREIIYRDHRVIYRLSPRSIEILTVRHGRRRFEPAELSERE